LRQTRVLGRDHIFSFPPAPLAGPRKQAFLRTLSEVSPSLSEAVGTGWLVLTLVASRSAVAVGAVAVAVTFNAWRRSGGHFNPALTLAVYLLKRRMFRVHHMAFYITAQLVGAVLGALLARSLPPAALPLGPQPDDPLELDPAARVFFLFLYGAGFFLSYISNTEADFDEGFLHTALMSALTLAALGYAFHHDPLQARLFNPAAVIALAGAGLTPPEALVDTVRARAMSRCLWGAEPSADP
jgi:aquaporin Z